MNKTICALCTKLIKANQVPETFEDSTMGFEHQAHKKCLNDKDLRKAFERKVDEFYCGGDENTG